MSPVNVTSIDVLPEPLKRVRELAKSRLSAIFGNMFDSADDALFELADKATTNIDQTMFFDSMRQVRIQRQGMESVFMQKVEDGFRQLYFSENDFQSEPEDEGQSTETLALVQDDELEESVAIRGMVSKATSHCDEALSHLTQRIDHLVRAKEVTEQNNPISPQKLCEAFSLSSNLLELDIRAKLVVYKLFEKYVLGVIGELYEESNSLLIERGVLPEIGKATKAGKVRPRSNAARGGQQKPATATAEQGEDSEIFDFLRGLLSERQISAQDSGSSSPVVGQGPALEHDDLVQVLSTIQQGQQQNNLVSSPSEQVDVRRAIFNLLEQSGSGSTQRSIGRVDDDVINLVSMLFEFILDDHNLATPMKALLARLQIPMLKVAVMDKTFFSRGGHPARKLLNELATAAVGWNETADLSRDKLYGKVKTVVERVLDDFVDDVSIFQLLLDDVTTFMGAERHRAALIEQRTRDAEEGLGKSQYARAVVGDVLNKKAEGLDLPEVVVDLLREGWSNYMFLIHVKQGAESQEWQDALATVDDLIWSVQSVPDKSRTGQLLKLIPSLLQRLRSGLSSISFSKVKMRALFKELEAIHLNCLKGPVLDKHVEDSSPSPEPPELEAKAPQSKANEQITPSEVVVKSPVIIEKTELSVADEKADAEDAEDEYYKRVDSLGSGTWVEMVKDDKKQRAKLVAIIRATGKYIFVNRVGMKVAEKTRSGLASELRDGVLNILDDSLLFDRALESVIGHLREMKD